MSFQEARSDISICNKALGRIHQAPLSGALLDPANQQKLAGRECNRFYKSVVRGLLTKHHFGLATKRAALVEVGNERTVEWVSAYQPPSDMAFPVTISPFTSGQVGYYEGLGYLIARVAGKPIFLYQSGTIWASQAGAQLDYVSFGITEADFNDTFENLVVIFLSAQLAVSVAKDREMMNDYKQEGVNELNLAIAHSLNATQPRYGDFIGEAELVRGGAFHDVLMGWRY